MSAVTRSRAGNLRELASLERGIAAWLASAARMQKAGRLDLTADYTRIALDLCRAHARLSRTMVDRGEGS